MSLLGNDSMIINKMAKIGPYLLTIQIHLENRGWTAGFPAANSAESARRCDDNSNLVYYLCNDSNV